MPIGSVSSAGITAIQRGLEKLDQAAETVARLPLEAGEVGASETKSSDLIKALVSGKEAELETQAGVKVIGTYDETVGTLLDILA